MTTLSAVLPNDCIHEILLFVDDPLCILPIRLVSLQFNYECCRDALWRQLLRYVCPLLRDAYLWNSLCQAHPGDVESESESLLQSPSRLMRMFFTKLLPRRTLLALQHPESDDWETILTKIRVDDIANIRELFVNPPSVPWYSPADPLPLTGLDVVGSDADGLSEDQKRECLPFVIANRRESRITKGNATTIVCLSCGNEFSDPLKSNSSSPVNRALHELCFSWVSSPYTPKEYHHRGFCSRDCFRRQLVGSSDYVRPSHPLLDKEEEILKVYKREEEGSAPLVVLLAAPSIPENSRVLEVLAEEEEDSVDGSVVDEKGLGNTLCRDVLADYYGSEQSDVWEKLADFSYQTLTNGFRGGDTAFESGVRHRYFHYVAWGGGSFDGFYDETGVEGMGSLLEGPELGLRVGSVKTHCSNRMNHEAKIRWVFFLYRAA